MPHYAQTHRIDDWNKPWLPAPLRLINKTPEHLIKRWIKLDESTLLDKACKATGLKDFGSDDFLIPLRILLKDIEKYDHITPLGRISIASIFHQQLCSRLCIEDRLKHEPEILQQQVNKPVLIAGLPRTGTTHLHNLLAQVTGFRYLPWWQTLSPVRSYQQVNSSAFNFDNRRFSNGIKLLIANYALPLFRRMHEMELDMPHEELTLSALCFRSFFFEGAYQVPSYRQWYSQQDNTEAYLYMKKILQILQTEPTPMGKKADAHWILKSPQHVDQLEAIHKAMPDAKIILTHRDPCRAVLSMITMMLYTSRQVYRPDRLQEEAQAWLTRLEQMLRSSQEQMTTLPNSQVMHVSFENFMADQEGTIKEVLLFSEVEYDNKSRQAVNTLLQRHTRDRHGRIEYRFEDLGLDEEEVRERFNFYTPP